MTFSVDVSVLTTLAHPCLLSARQTFALHCNMVQMQPHLTLTLEALGCTGVVLPLEQKVRLQVRPAPL